MVRQKVATARSNKRRNLATTEDTATSSSSGASSDSNNSRRSSTSEEEEFYEVENIIAYRETRDGVGQWRVRWKGFAPEDDTWEERANLEGSPAFWNKMEKLQAKWRLRRRRSGNQISTESLGVNKNHRRSKGSSSSSSKKEQEEQSNMVTNIGNRRSLEESVHSAESTLLTDTDSGAGDSVTASYDSYGARAPVGAAGEKAVTVAGRFDAEEKKKRAEKEVYAVGSLQQGRSSSKSSSRRCSGEAAAVVTACSGIEIGRRKTAVVQQQSLNQRKYSFESRSVGESSTGGEQANRDDGIGCRKSRCLFLTGSDASEQNYPIIYGIETEPPPHHLPDEILLRGRLSIFRLKHQQQRRDFSACSQQDSQTNAAAVATSLNGRLSDADLKARSLRWTSDTVSKHSSGNERNSCTSSSSSSSNISSDKMSSSSGDAHSSNKSCNNNDPLFYENKSATGRETESSGGGLRNFEKLPCSSRLVEGSDVYNNLALDQSWNKGRASGEFGYGEEAVSSSSSSRKGSTSFLKRTGITKEDERTTFSVIVQYMVDAKYIYSLPFERARLYCPQLLLSYLMERTTFRSSAGRDAAPNTTDSATTTGKGQAETAAPRKRSCYSDSAESSSSMRESDMNSSSIFTNHVINGNTPENSSSSDCYGRRNSANYLNSSENDSTCYGSSSNLLSSDMFSHNNNLSSNHFSYSSSTTVHSRPYNSSAYSSNIALKN